MRQNETLIKNLAPAVASESPTGHRAKPPTGATPRLGPLQAHLPTTGPTTISLTALLTALLTDAPTSPTPNSTTTGTICAKSSRALRNPGRAIALRQMSLSSSQFARHKSWDLRWGRLFLCPLHFLLEAGRVGDV